MDTDFRGMPIFSSAFEAPLILPSWRRVRAAPVLVFALSIALISCESEQERQLRLENEAREIQLEQEREARDLMKEREQAEALRMQQAREKRELELNAQFGANKLRNGALPWKSCFGHNASCEEFGCSEIEVEASTSDDVVVVVKRNGVVKKHAYIAAGRSYTFQLPDGLYQTYFYYGEGWYPDKEMDSKLCDDLRGGFLRNETWSKDDPTRLEGQILTYTLQPLVHGNFQTKDASQLEAL